jgi:hypothetical protein
MPSLLGMIHYAKAGLKGRTELLRAKLGKC